MEIIIWRKLMNLLKFKNIISKISNEYNDYNVKVYIGDVDETSISSIEISPSTESIIINGFDDITCERIYNVEDKEELVFSKLQKETDRKKRGGFSA
jgi:hypothetical protein